VQQISDTNEEGMVMMLREVGGCLQLSCYLFTAAALMVNLMVN
jgi:hypothetical protein